MHASTEPQTTEPKTLDIASLFEKGVFVTVDDHGPPALPIIPTTFGQLAE